MPTVVQKNELTNQRHLPSWALLAFSAGAVNAGALLACQVFVSHVTGTVTRIGVDASQVLALEYLLVLVAFISGAAAAIILAKKRGSSTGPAYWVPLTTVAAFLIAVAGLGSVGAFGVFGGTVETAHDFALLAVLSFAMGMQNAAVAVSTGLAVRTTHMTGPATDIGVALAELVSSDAAERAAARDSLVLRTTKLIAFVVGGVVMAVLCPRVGFLAFVLPAVTVLTATVRSYAPWRRSTAAEA